MMFAGRVVPTQPRRSVLSGRACTAFSTMMPTLLLVARLTTLVLVLQAMSADVSAQSIAPKQALDWRQVFVPANQPEAWPPGDWVPVATADYRKLISRKAQTSTTVHVPSAWIESTEYQARLEGATLNQGGFRATVVNRTAEWSPVPLGLPSLAILSLRWSDTNEECIWGTTVDGKAMLVARPTGGQIRGDWSLQGQRVLDDAVFNIHLLPGVMSRLHLDLPADRQLSANAGVVIPPDASADRASVPWQIDLGQRQQARVTISRKVWPVSPSLLLVEESSLYSLALDEISIQSDFSLINAPQQITPLEFQLPAGFSLESISLGGEAQIPYRKSARRLVIVDVSGAEGERRTVLRIRGRTRLDRGTPVAIPRVQLRASASLASTLRLSVARPLEIKSIDSSGFRVMSTTSDGLNGDLIEFEEYERESRLQVTVDLPRTEFTTRTLTHIRWDVTDPELNSVISVNFHAGSTSLLQCKVPDGWQILRLESVEGADGPGIAAWRVHTNKAGDEELLVEFAEAVTPQQEAVLRLVARQIDGHRARTWTIPTFDLQRARTQQSYYGIHPPHREQLITTLDPTFTQIDVSDLPEAWDEFIGWSDADLAGASRMLFLQTDAPDALARPLFRLREINDQPREIDQVFARDQKDSSVLDTDVSTITGELIGHSVIPAVRHGWALHRVWLRVTAEGAGHRFLVRVPEGARLVRVQVDRQDVEGSDLPRAAEVSLPDDAAAHEIQLDYHTSVNAGWLSADLEVPLPEWGGMTTQITWGLEYPADSSLLSASGSIVRGSIVRLRWIDRLLGPLGHAFRTSSLQESRMTADGATQMPASAEEVPSRGHMRLFACHSRSTLTHSRSVCGIALLLSACPGSCCSSG